MSTNFEWQNQYVREQIQNRLQEAESHRQAKLGPAKRGLPLAGVVRSLIRALGKATSAKPSLSEPARNDSGYPETPLGSRA